MAEFLSKQNYEKNLDYIKGNIFEKNEKEIVNSFNKNSKKYYEIITYLKIQNSILLIAMIYSFSASLVNVYKSKKNYKYKIAKINIVFFLIYVLVIFLHVNIVHVQSRWFFTYFPISILSCLYLIKQTTLYIERRFHRTAK